MAAASTLINAIHSVWEHIFNHPSSSMCADVLIKISIILIKAVHKGELCFGLEASRQLVAFSALISGYYFTADPRRQ